MSRYRVGLTGGIASGKSTVGKIFQTLGIDVIDTDTIAATLTQPNGEALEPLREALGDWAFTKDGIFDRASVRQRVFDQPDLRRRLESVLHPLIRQQLLVQMQQATSPYVIGIVPLIKDKATWKPFFHRLVAMDIDEAKQIARAEQRDKKQDVQKIMEAQITADERRKIADDIIYNNESHHHLKTSIDNLHLYYSKLASTLL